MTNNPSKPSSKVMKPARAQMKVTLAHCFKVLATRLEKEANEAQAKGHTRAAKRLMKDSSAMAEHSREWAE